ncbi:amino acid ABC transporter permease [Oricola indica]|uniref:amino acid ABC transporter permease n=1 Tax=Oricola indica TaxID=2872591 RepID=UPI001CBE64EF|nr:amino acid ABC transporter permease [Oricola indica]
MDDFLQNFVNWQIVERYWPYLLRGLGQTAMLSAIAIPVGIFAGLAIALMATSKSRLLRGLTVVYVDFFRAFPPLVLLILINAGLPHFGLRLPPLGSIIVALLLNSSSYYGEIFRAGLLSVPRGLEEAARATGLSTLQAAMHVRVPIATRNVLPDLLSNTLELVKLTSIAAVVTFVELTQAARVVQGLTFNATPIVIAALLYFIVLWPLARLVSRLETRSLSARR